MDGEIDLSITEGIPQFKEGFSLDVDFVRVAGTPLKLKCPYTANPPAAVKWYKDNTPNWEQESDRVSRVSSLVCRWAM